MLSLMKSAYFMIIDIIIFTARNAVREGNVFSCACLSVNLFTGDVTNTQTCSNLFTSGSLKWDSYNPAPAQALFKLDYYVAHTSIGKRAVGFRLKGPSC